MNSPIPDLTGYIFEYKGGYWKIQSPKHAGYSSYSNPPTYYPVIKCTKHGKEFQSRNSIVAEVVEKIYLEGSMVKCGLTEDVKVSTAGKESGARKRRINHLEAELGTMIKELNKLLEQEKAPYRHKLTMVDVTG